MRRSHSISATVREKPFSSSCSVEMPAGMSVCISRSDNLWVDSQDCADPCDLPSLDKLRPQPAQNASQPLVVQLESLYSEQSGKASCTIRAIANPSESSPRT